ncbi:PhnB protein [Rhizomicrobium palustre]|uniref:PhnB protein n=1 Tax=Rhizomicrobium palustre TaxID=189966 RepID=A0A846MWN9_9PROT|nr:VOC family protein [Rhizomicrobium palustre]NIK87649.1 PhnB protein [Rhizomicrobium palustre]
MHVNAYLFFNGRCAEALEFYAKAVGAKTLLTMPFKSMPNAEGHISPEMADQIMHAEFKLGDTTIFASDGMPDNAKPHGGYALTISAASVEEAERMFNALGEGGSVYMPLGETFFAERFGSFADKFGIDWMVIFEGKKAP